MPSRVIATFLAFVLLWSGLSTIEAVTALAQPSLERQYAVAQADGHSDARDGSVEDHHLDDLPSQVQSDPPPETPGMLPAPLKPGAPSAVMAPRRVFASAETGPPFLAGPLRPPCSSALAG